VTLLQDAGAALHLAAAMGWEILWGLILGFLLSAVVDVMVSKAERPWKAVTDSTTITAQGTSDQQAAFGRRQRYS